jgi:hypothetical protein
MAAPTYTLELALHGAHGLPVSDVDTLSCNPYIRATLVVPGFAPLGFRTPTARRTRSAGWCPTAEGQHAPQCVEGTKGVHGPACLANGTWIVAGVPASGFRLDVRFSPSPNHTHELTPARRCW